VQTSADVQALPSSQVVPFGCAGFEQAPVPGSQAPCVWQASGAGQTTGLAPTQLPARQASTVVQALPSLQAVPSAATGLEQSPVALAHTPTTWQASRALQTTGAPLLQTPARQVSASVHGLPSLQAVPSATAGLEHWPVAWSQAPAEWHWSAAGQVTPTQ
jgi:hypothetical protein